MRKVLLLNTIIQLHFFEEPSSPYCTFVGSKEELKGFHVVLVMARGKMMKYLEWMIGKGFVEMDSEGFVYLTKKGET